MAYEFALDKFVFRKIYIIFIFTIKIKLLSLQDIFK